MIRKALLLSLALTLCALAQPSTHLVIVGGGNHPPAGVEKIYHWAGEKQARLLVIPWATSEPDENFVEFSRDYQNLPLESIQRAPLAPLDPKSRALFLSQLEQATGVWFSGGDQVKIMEVLRDPELLEALRRKFAQGTVFSGTSAGCAIMSLRMLTGEGDVTLLDGRQIELREGLGLLPPNVIVDQHFLKRQRENRLFGLILENPDALGVGIDESTALVVTDGVEAEVVGESQVMLVRRQEPNALKIWLFKPGQRFRLSDD